MLCIRLLGTFQLTYNAQPVTAINTARLQSFLAYLVLHAGEQLSRQRLAFLFWPDSTEGQSRTNLRKALFDLRQVLPDADHFLRPDRNTVCWPDDTNFELDVAELTGLLDQFDDGRHDHTSLMAIVEHYRGELLAGLYDDWIIEQRGQIHRRVQRAMAELIGQLEDRRDYAAGVRYAQRLLDIDPLDEATYRRLMKLHALLGDRAGALRVYHDCVHVMQHELGVEPDESTQTIYERILNRIPRAETAASQESIQYTDAVKLVGREVEWQVLLKAWRRSMQGRAQFVAISGEAGIGKTRLAEEMLSWVRRQGYLTAQVRSHDTHGMLAYAPVADALRALDRYRPIDRLDDLWQIEIARLMPELLASRPDLPQPAPMSESWQRLHLFQAISHALFTDGEPLLLLFDDLQWCDPETLEWLHFFIEQARDQPLMILSTVRDDELDAKHPYHRLRSALQRGDRMIALQLSPLDEAQTLTLANQLEPADLSPSQAADLFTHTGGNPLFVIESVRAGTEGEGELSAEYAATGLPPKVYATIESRLARLSPQALEIAALVASAGMTCTYEMLMAAARQDEDTLVDSLDELWRRRIVVEQGEGYGFSHDRLRDVAYAELSGARRRLLHRHIANALLTLHAGGLDAVYGQLAEQSDRAGAIEDAIRYYRLAGDHARRLYALAEALELYQRSLALSGTGQGYNELLEKSAQLHLDLYHGEEAVQAYRQLLQNVKEQDEAVRKIKLLLRLGWAHYIVAMDNPASDAVQNSWDLFERAYQAAKEHDDWRSMIHARVGTRYHIMFSMEYSGEGRRNIDEALALSRKANDDRLRLDSWMAAFHFRTPIEWVREGERLAYRLPPDLERANLIELKFLLQVAHGVTGDLARSVAYGNACIDLATASGMPPVQYSSYNALALLQQGRYSEAWQSLQQDVTDESHPFAATFKSFVTGIYLVDVLAYADAVGLLAQVVEQARHLHRPWLAELATVHLARALALGGLADDAKLSAMSEVLTKLNTTLLGRIVGLPAVAIGEIAIALDKPAAAIDCLLTSITVAEQEGRNPDALMATEVLARSYLGLDRFEEALDVTNRALAQAETMKHRSTQWRLLDVQAQALQAAGYREAAQETIRHCTDMLHEISVGLPKPEQQMQLSSDSRILAIGELVEARTYVKGAISDRR